MGLILVGRRFRRRKDEKKTQKHQQRGKGSSRLASWHCEAFSRRLHSRIKERKVMKTRAMRPSGVNSVENDDSDASREKNTLLSDLFSV